jgi:hypothetical protein
MEKFQLSTQIGFDNAQLAVLNILRAFANSQLGPRYSQERILTAVSTARTPDAASRALRHRISPIKSRKK